MPFARALPRVFHVLLETQVWEAKLCCLLSTSYPAGALLCLHPPNSFLSVSEHEFLEDKTASYTSLSPQ